LQLKLFYYEILSTHIYSVEIGSCLLENCIFLPQTVLTHDAAGVGDVPKLHIVIDDTLIRYTADLPRCVRIMLCAVLYTG